MARPKRRLPSPVPEEVLTVAEAAELLRVSESTILRAIQQGLLPSFRLARRRLVPKDLLLARAFSHGPANQPDAGGAGGHTGQAPQQGEADEREA